jgi:hypothetical protein
LPHLLSKDNKNIDTIIGIGSRKHTLQDINIEIHNTCEENNVHLSSKWIPRENNNRADSLSRLYSDCDDTIMGIYHFG